MVKLTYEQNSIGAIVMVETKPIYVKILVRCTIKVATRAMPGKN